MGRTNNKVGNYTLISKSEMGIKDNDFIRLHKDVKFDVTTDNKDIVIYNNSSVATREKYKYIARSYEGFKKSGPESKPESILKEDIRTLKGLLDMLAKSNLSMEQRFSMIDSQITKYQDKINNYKKSIDTNNSKISRINEKISNNKAKDKEKNTIKNLEELNTKLNEEINELKEKINAYRKQGIENPNLSRNIFYCDEPKIAKKAISANMPPLPPLPFKSSNGTSVPPPPPFKSSNEIPVSSPIGKKNDEVIIWKKNYSSIILVKMIVRSCDNLNSMLKDIEKYISDNETKIRTKFKDSKSFNTKLQMCVQQLKKL